MIPKIAIIDSGVGGLTVLREIVALLPYMQYIYCADTKYAPYGERSNEDLIELVKSTMYYLMQEGVTYVVIACNTISGRVFTAIQKEFNDVTFIQMIEHGLIDIRRYMPHAIGIIATRSTVYEGTYIQAVQHVFPEATVQAIPAPQLVVWAEQGYIYGHEVEEYIKHIYQQFTIPLDILILACTHFPLFMDSFNNIIPSNTIVYNPAYSVARYVYTLVCTHISNTLLQQDICLPHIQWYITGETRIVYELAHKMKLL